MSVAFSALISSSSSADPIAEAANGSDPLVAFVATNTSGPLDPVSLPQGLLSAEVFRGPGLVARTDFPGTFDSSNWSTDSTLADTDSGTWIAFRFEIETGYQAQFDAIHLAYQDGSSNESPRELQMRWNVDAFADPFFADSMVLAWPDEDFNTINLPLPQGPLTGTIEIRLYGFAAVSTIGVLGLANSAQLLVDGQPASVGLFGELQPIPEPASAIVVLACAGLGFVLLRRRRIAS